MKARFNKGKASHLNLKHLMFNVKRVKSHFFWEGLGMGQCSPCSIVAADDMLTLIVSSVCYQQEVACRVMANAW